MVEGCYTYIVINESQLCNSSINQFLSNKYSVSPHWLQLHISFKKKYIQNYQSNLSLVRLFPCEGCTPFHGESQGVGGCPGFLRFVFRVSCGDFPPRFSTGFSSCFDRIFHSSCSDKFQQLFYHDKKAQSSTKFSPPKYANF